jgi:hypothetical protein
MRKPKPAVHQDLETVEVPENTLDPHLEGVDQEPQSQVGEDDHKSPMTPREQKFLEIYFSGEKITMEQAARRAGFKAKNKTALCNAARRVLMKYECQTDPREIFRRIGLGEEAIAKKLLAIADDTGIAAGTRVQALSIASKCLGLQREVVEGASGARIVIHPAAEPAPPAQSGEGTAGQETAKAISLVK